MADYHILSKSKYVGTFLRFPVAESKTLFFGGISWPLFFIWAFQDRVSYFPYFAKQSPCKLNTTSMAAVVILRHPFTTLNQYHNVIFFTLLTYSKFLNLELTTYSAKNKIQILKLTQFLAELRTYRFPV